MLSTSFWLIIVRLVRVKTNRSLKIKFFVKVKNKVHVTIGHVCDFARNYGPAPNDLKVKILYVLWNFVLSNTQISDNIFTNHFIYFVWNSIVRISFVAIFCLVTFVTFWCTAWVTFVTFLIKIMCSLMRGQKSFTSFVLEVLLKYQVTNWWLKNLIMWSNKEADFFPWNQQKFHFPWNGPAVRLKNGGFWKWRCAVDSLGDLEKKKGLTFISHDFFLGVNQKTNFLHSGELQNLGHTTFNVLRTPLGS